VSFRGVLLEALDEGRGAARAACDHENRVVAADRPDDLRQLRAVERDGQGLRLAAARPDDDELLNTLDAAQELGGGPLERGERRLRIDP